MTLVLQSRHIAISKMVRPDYVCHLRREISSKLLKCAPRPEISGVPVPIEVKFQGAIKDMTLE